MYLTDLTDAQKEYIRGTILMDNWRSKYDFFLILDAIIYYCCPINLFISR